MPRTKALPKEIDAIPSQANGIPETPDVLTLDEVAAYLRVAPDAVLRMIGDEQLPGRRFGADWRFAKTALEAWLGTPAPRQGLSSHFGEIKDDPFLEEMLRDIYARRGRPETEEQ